MFVVKVLQGCSLGATGTSGKERGAVLDSWHEIFGILRWETRLGCHLKHLVLSVRLGTGRCSIPRRGFQGPGAFILPWGAGMEGGLETPRLPLHPQPQTW